jgi:hypothetical protein
MDDSLSKPVFVPAIRRYVSSYRKLEEISISELYRFIKSLRYGLLANPKECWSGGEFGVILRTGMRL